MFAEGAAVGLALHLQGASGLLEVRLLHVLHLCAPRQLSLDEEGHQIQQALHVVPARGQQAFVVVDAGKLHVAVLYLRALVLQLREVLGGLRVLVPAGPAEVDQEQLAVLLALAQHDMLGAEVVVDEELEVEVLEDREELKADHQGRLEAQPAAALLDLLGEGALQFLQDDEVVLLFLAAPVHVGNSDSALHALVHLPFLQQTQAPLLHLRSLGLLALQDQRVVGLGVDGAVKQRVVVAFEPRVEAEPAHQADFYWLHSKYYLNL